MFVARDGQRREKASAKKMGGRSAPQCHSAAIQEDAGPEIAVEGGETNAGHLRTARAAKPPSRQMARG